MRTVQMTMDEELVARLDAAARELGLSRSAFTRSAVRTALQRLELERREQEHRQAYLDHPARPDEFDLDDDASEWSDEWSES